MTPLLDGLWTHRATHPNGVADLEGIVEHHDALQIHWLAVLHVLGTDLQDKGQVDQHHAHHGRRRAHKEPAVHRLIWLGIKY